MKLCSVINILMTVIAVTNAQTASEVIPPGWEDFCVSEFDPNAMLNYVDGASVANHVILLSCHITGNSGDKIRFQTLREHLKGLPNVAVFLHVKCSNGGKISLPWPMKANGLVGLAVKGCVLTDKYADFGNPNITAIPDQLRVLEIRDSAWQSDGSGFEKIRTPESLAKLTADYDCGQDSTIEYLVTSNVSDLFLAPERDTTLSTPKMKSSEEGVWIDIRKYLNSENFNSVGHHKPTGDEGIDMTVKSSPEVPENRDNDLLNNNTSESKAAEKDFDNLLKNLLSLDIKCNYEKLKIIDESLPHILPVMHFKLMVQGSSYPELRVMNYSRSGIHEFPQELRDFPLYFPKLEYLDLSKNYLTEVHLPVRHRQTDGQVLTLDVTYNLITNLSVNDVISWSKSDGVLVDIRGNPIHCGCEIEHLLDKLRSHTFFEGNLHKYSYIRELECASPPQFRGKKLSDILLNCGTDEYSEVPQALTSAKVAPETLGIIIGCSVAAAVIVVAALFALLVLNWLPRYISKAASEKDSEASFSDLKTKGVQK